MERETVKRKEEQITKRYNSIRDIFVKYFPPFGRPTEDYPRAKNLSDALDLLYSLWKYRPLEYTEAMAPLLDYFDELVRTGKIADLLVKISEMKL